MAKSGEKVKDFLVDISKKLQPIWKEEREEMPTEEEKEDLVVLEILMVLISFWIMTTMVL